MNARRKGTVIPDRVTLLADVAEIVSRSHDLDETLSNVVDLVAKRLDADVCSIYLLAGADLKAPRRDHSHLRVRWPCLRIGAGSQCRDPDGEDSDSLHMHMQAKFGGCSQ